MTQATLPQIEQLVSQLSTQEQLLLVERIAEQLRTTAEQRVPRDLYGAFKGQFPDELDVDAALREIRTAWKKNLDDITPVSGEGNP